MFVTGGVLVVVMVVGAVLLLIRGDPYAGGLIWNDFTKSYAGGEGSLPAGVENKDFLRCKACHGWDAMGANGGYVRRTGFPEKDSRPWPISGTDLIAIGGRFSLAEVTHDGGRLFTTENNEGPDFMQEGALTSRQARDVRAFVNRGPKVGDVATLDITQNPVRYRFTDATPEGGQSSILRTVPSVTDPMVRRRTSDETMGSSSTSVVMASTARDSTRPSMEPIRRCRASVRATWIQPTRATSWRGFSSRPMTPPGRALATSHRRSPSERPALRGCVPGTCPRRRRR